VIKLIESGLFGDRLVSVDTPVMVDRYKACLADIGLPTTNLTSFHIDGWGWSPEIAEELNNSFYLSHGFANPYGVVITPEQAEASIYFPFHSFDWDVHQNIFKEYTQQITDITAQCGLWFELDQNISAYRTAQDLLMVDVFKVRFRTVDRIMESAQEQRALIHDFNETEFAWADEKVRNAIIESGKKHGDLRYRSIELAPMPFGRYQSFYTLAFNGVYVFKNLPNGKPLLVFGNNSSSMSGELSHDRVEYNLNDPGLVPYLYSQKLIEDDVNYFIKYPYLIELIMDYMLISSAEKIKLKVPSHMNKKTRKNMILNSLISSKAMNDDYFEFEKIQKALSMKKDIKVSDEIRGGLLHPTPSLNVSDKIVLWQLLSNLANSNPVIGYLFDKPRFFNEYKTWNEDMQKTVVESILEHRYIFNELIN
jgi:Family of unknown function (DUF6638)